MWPSNYSWDTINQNEKWWKESFEKVDFDFDVKFSRVCHVQVSFIVIDEPTSRWPFGYELRWESKGAKIG